tara:strand:- start:19664 stop:20173 length:510 start_codon:yes stop_codon:yes gene_type:complete
MEQNLASKQVLKDKISNFYNLHKFKIFILIFLLLSILFTTIFLQYNNQKKNILISEKYIEAGLNLATNKKEKARLMYEEIILSKNKFYSILSLNTILEKNLISDKGKILEYFKILESSSNTKENNDLIIFKKALFLIKVSDNKTGRKLLNDLIEKDSKLKSIAEDLLLK